MRRWQQKPRSPTRFQVLSPRHGPLDAVNGQKQKAMMSDEPIMQQQAGINKSEIPPVLSMVIEDKNTCNTLRFLLSHFCFRHAPSSNEKENTGGPTTWAQRAP